MTGVMPLRRQVAKSLLRELVKGTSKLPLQAQGGAAGGAPPTRTLNIIPPCTFHALVKSTPQHDALWNEQMLPALFHTIRRPNSSGRTLPLDWEKLKLDIVKKLWCTKADTPEMSQLEKDAFEAMRFLRDQEGVRARSNEVEQRGFRVGTVASDPRPSKDGGLLCFARLDVANLRQAGSFRISKIVQEIHDAKGRFIDSQSHTFTFVVQPGETAHCIMARHVTDPEDSDPQKLYLSGSVILQRVATPVKWGEKPQSAEQGSEPKSEEAGDEDESFSLRMPLTVIARG